MARFRLKIRGRLYAGFAALVAVGVIMSGVAVRNLWTVRDQVAKISALSDHTARILQISNQLQAIQRTNLRYIHDGNEPALKEAAERETAATELLQAAARDAFSDERRKLYEDLVGDVAKIRTLRDNLHEAVRQIKAGKATLLPGERTWPPRQPSWPSLRAYPRMRTSQPQSPTSNPNSSWSG